MRVTLSIMKAKLKEKVKLESLSGGFIDLVVSEFCKEILAQLSLGNSVILPNSVTLVPRVRRGGLRYDVSKREKIQSKDRWSIQTNCAKKLMTDMSTLPLPKQRKTTKGRKKQVSKECTPVSCLSKKHCESLS